MYNTYQNKLSQINRDIAALTESNRRGWQEIIGADASARSELRLNIVENIHRLERLLADRDVIFAAMDKHGHEQEA